MMLVNWHEAIRAGIVALNALGVVDVRWVAAKLNDILVGLSIVDIHDSVAELILELLYLNLNL